MRMVSCLISPSTLTEGQVSYETKVASDKRTFLPIGDLSSFSFSSYFAQVFITFALKELLQISMAEK